MVFIRARREAFLSYKVSASGSIVKCRKSFPKASVTVSLHKFYPKIWVSRSCRHLHTCLLHLHGRTGKRTKNGQPCRICSIEHNKKGNN